MASAVGPVQQQPGSHAIDDDLEWTDECNDLLGQVLETQSEIASLLKDHGDTKQSLEVIKKQCDEEVSFKWTFAHGPAAQAAVLQLYKTFLGCSMAELVSAERYYAAACLKCSDRWL